tara:strand:- start:339 stop:815 length:477 start_codon:yes stop_codon:yes gene_type:complete
MSEFNISSWLKDQYLTEAGLGSTKSQSLANAINTAMLQIDDSMSYKDFADAVASILIDEYGTHNFTPFMEVLHARLGMNESINENEDLSSLDAFLKYFKSYDPYYEYIDDGGQYERAKQNNNRILARFNALSPEDKKVAFKSTQDHFESDRGRNAFKL